MVYLGPGLADDGGGWLPPPEVFGGACVVVVVVVGVVVVVVVVVLVVVVVDVDAVDGGGDVGDTGITNCCIALDYFTQGSKKQVVVKPCIAKHLFKFQRKHINEAVSITYFISLLIMMMVHFFECFE